MLRDLLIERGAKIGKDVFFGTEIHIDPGFERFLEIEDGVVISHGVTIILHDSSLNNILGVPIKVGKVKICKNVYIGANTTILCGVEIGDNSLIGANSLVTKSIPNNTVAYGIPSKIICSLSEFKDIFIREMNTASNFFYWDIIPWRDRGKNLTQLDEQNFFLDFIYKIRCDLFNDALDFLDFENVNTARYLLSGWYNLEKWPPSIRWTGKKALAYLKVNGDSSRLFIKAITYYPGINADISINRCVINKVSFDSTEWKVLEIELPEIDTNIIEVTIEVDKTWVPDEVIKNGDTRELGIAVHRIWIE